MHVHTKNHYTQVVDIAKEAMATEGLHPLSDFELIDYVSKRGVFCTRAILNKAFKFYNIQHATERKKQAFAKLKQTPVNTTNNNVDTIALLEQVIQQLKQPKQCTCSCHKK